MRWEGNVEEGQDWRVLLKENLNNQCWDIKGVYLAQDFFLVVGSYELGNEGSGAIKSRKFLDQLSDSLILTNACSVEFVTTFDTSSWNKTLPPPQKKHLQYIFISNLNKRRSTQSFCWYKLVSFRSSFLCLAECSKLYRRDENYNKNVSPGEQYLKQGLVQAHSFHFHMHDYTVLLGMFFSAATYKLSSYYKRVLCSTAKGKLEFHPAPLSSNECRWE
jgi:hypothetical protein